ncbi:5-methyltetrahydropteroyltriglutamate--homocysteine S-methyltransferase [Porticoccaceae bacterium LTM1]|nr:5-methyltetrahydropteroyltriglutamate--homocysteine S-methyltransferase [Porticoccaceae bacterium LTM1]
MTITTHNLGFPRIGLKRQLKFAQESYWQGKITQDELLGIGAEIRAENWQLQKAAGIDLIPVGDFAWYDQVLTTSALLGAIPARHLPADGKINLDTLFRCARGQAPSGDCCSASDMTKWFNTNYHYIVPELSEDQQFSVQWTQLFEELEQAQQLGYNAKPVLLGPLSYLWLAKCSGNEFDKLALLERLLPVYADILNRLASSNVEWVQLDEPILSLDLPAQWQQAFERSYHQLQRRDIKLLVASYFGGYGNNLYTASRLPVAGLHLDAVSAPDELEKLADQLPPHKILSVGIVNGRNVWRNHLSQSVARLEATYAKLGNRLWIAPSCSLLHSPIDLDVEENLDPEIRSWLAFGKQKLAEVSAIAQVLSGKGDETTATLIATVDKIVEERSISLRVHNRDVQQRLQKIDQSWLQRSEPFAKRRSKQITLPAFPTTTIGSFPQTGEIRSIRRRYRQGDISAAEYQQVIQNEIAFAIERQEQIGLDVLVHGEAERNDMVEYFGELLQGYAFTATGWVQSYGSRCVKPPIIYGDVHRPEPMTVEWIRYAQSLTEKPVKGMLTGPVTMLGWAFPREDISRETCARQIALALRDEVADLQAAGIKVIQIDEPALREGLPLKQSQWPAYLRWAVDAFRLSTAVADSATQIHTHMCYSQFNDIIEAIAELDADVITIETARSAMKLLQAFEEFTYPNEIGPGVYDIHSPNVPTVDSIVELLSEASQRIPASQLWVNPDCGLKTRGWPEVEAALVKMVEAAKQARAELA